MLNLTARHKEILSLIAEGKTHKEISNELRISQNTVKTHTRVMLGMNSDIPNMVNLAVTAVKQGII